MARVNEHGLEHEIKSYLGQDEEYDSVVVIKIPKKYFGDITSTACFLTEKLSKYSFTS